MLLQFERGDKVSPKMGQKIKENTKDIMLRTRIDEETYIKLEETAKILNVKKAEVVRRGIESEYQKVKEYQKREAVTVQSIQLLNPPTH